MSLKHREDSITSIRLREAQKTKTATSAELVGGSIVLELPEGGVCTCTTVKFNAPCDCSAITGGIVIDGVTYTVVDALGTCITGRGGYWTKGATVAVMIDCGNARAFILNAAGIAKAGDRMIGELYAGKQDPDEYLVRNQRLAPAEEEVTPDAEGEICWWYE